MTEFSVTKNGVALDELDESLYNWNEATRTFSSKESGLVLDFNGIDDVSFDTGSYCTFKTGSYCVVVRRDVFEVIQLVKGKKIRLNNFEKRATK